MNYIEMSKECESCRIYNDDPDCRNCNKLDKCWKEVNNE